ncbi:exosome 3-5 exoribonuclease subunit [Cryptosporidium ubiquitum]|uniref:Exosome 3-5 exoribonuclease subunit n=1 Tax=Cryptosporidium ubiquitum TaxID=857276 RepID=A0A1J4MDX3_9CRYT|nr:exosome 3-5 exoribonuclease subunit [Cryptosporidium ubiquitum]OII71228.1 exosome 3-5 exoribonuclease subunit [Cryptosporidium ubiquitum]
MASKKRESEELKEAITSLEQRVDVAEVVFGKKLSLGDLYSEDEIEKYISENVLVSPGCESCIRMKNRVMSILSDSEKSLMVQVLWSDLTNNFTYKFIPRLLSKPYNMGELGSKFNKVVERLILMNIEKEDNMINLPKEKRGRRDDFSKTYILPCQHPGIYSTNIQCLAPVGSDQTGLVIIDELSRLLHCKELIICQKFLNKSQFQIGNLYRYELNSLIWGVNGTIYYTGEDNEVNYFSSNKETPPSAHFNIKYSHPELYLPLSNTPLTFVKEPGELRRMIDDILNSMESYYNQSKDNEENNPFLLAIDVEHHSNQSYKGFVSLIQLSTRTHDYIIDPFNLFNEIQILNEITANPRILKVLHGSDYDIIWLQRDFSVYIVNMFDTGQAARILNTPGGFSLKNLLSIYCSLDIDKRFQLADWRERPLTSELIEYARGDTHYLLYVYDIMKNLLLLHTHKKNEFSILVSDAFLEVNNGFIVLNQNHLERFNFGDFVQEGLTNGESKLIKLTDLDPSALLTVLHNSRQICLKEYFEKPIDIWNFCFGIRTKMPKSSYKTPIDSAIITLISYYLFIWRESLARLLDVSNNYILKESMIIKICQKQPMNSNEILGLYPNIPANIKRHSEYILNIVTTVKNFVTSKSEDELFDFNSYISHIYSNIANNDTNSSDSNRYHIKNNYRVVSKDDTTDSQGTSCIKKSDSVGMDANTDSNRVSSLKKEEIPKSEKSLSDVSAQDTPVSSITKKRSVIIKKKTPDSNDRLADNLFGNSSKNYKKEVDPNVLPSNINKEEVSSRIIRGINGTLNGEVPNDFRNIKLKDAMESSSTPVKNSESPKEANSKKKITFEEYYSEKTEEDLFEDDNFTPLVSVRDKYSETDDYLYKKRKTRKIKVENDQEVQNLNQNPSSNIKERPEGNSPDLSSIIKENADILPASFACKSDLPGFVKNSQKEGNANKSKKFIESMKTKKWHKKR